MKQITNYRKIAQLRTPDEFRNYLNLIGAEIDFDEEVESGNSSPLAQTYHLKDGFTIGNRFCTQPMEGWDGTPDGKPTQFTYRRWKNFGQSGAKLVWGCEAVAVRRDGRANPNQLMINDENLPELISLRNTLVEAHEGKFGGTTDLLIGLQLTHSGRFARPNPDGKLVPVIVYHHPYLDQKFKIPADYPVITDQELDELIDDFVSAAKLACNAGYHFVDIKHCHGYLGHELLSAYNRPGKYGGSFENRTRFLRQIVDGIRASVPQLRIGVRLSAFDLLPFEPDPESHVGKPAVEPAYPFCFGANPSDARCIQLDEPKKFLGLLQDLDIQLVNITAGSPYYNPHIQRPAFFPPSDGYKPPEDPLVGVSRQITATAELKKTFPDLLIVGTAYSYLQEWLPNVAQYNVRKGKVDFIGLGRMLLSYPELPDDVLNGLPIDRKRLCRTFSDCITAPRMGLISGCFPLDSFYKGLPEAETIKKAKQENK